MRPLIAATLVVCWVSMAWAADDENPWKTAKVGDWVDYKTTGTGFSGKTKMTITAKDDKEVVYEVTGSFTVNGMEMTAPTQTLKIDLTKDYDAVAAANVANKDVKLEKVGEGKAKLKIGDKEYDTKWTQTKATATFNGIATVSEYKMWFCKDVPLGGLVKMETTVGSISSTLELVASGKK